MGLDGKSLCAIDSELTDDIKKTIIAVKVL
jgi:hypothetical protein